MKTTLTSLIAVLLLAAPALAQTASPQAASPQAAQTQTIDITGTWDMSIGTSQGASPATLIVTRDGEKLAATINSPQGEAPVEVTLKDKAVALELSIQTPNGAITIVMSGTVDGDTMKGTADFGGRGSGEWSAKRTAAAPAGQPPTQEKTAATMTGTWNFEVTHVAGVSTPTVTITQTGEKLAGKYAGSYGESELTGSIKGAEFTFTIEIGTEQKVTVVYTGTLTADTVKGNVSMGELGEGTFTGKRK
ncbi:MAG: hypothetical protein ABIP65_02800 [Vicinamibacterales bacterium]